MCVSVCLSVCLSVCPSNSFKCWVGMGGWGGGCRGEWDWLGVDSRGGEWFYGVWIRGSQKGIDSWRLVILQWVWLVGDFKMATGCLMRFRFQGRHV